jgi:hypothetical protein
VCQCWPRYQTLRFMEQSTHPRQILTYVAMCSERQRRAWWDSPSALRNSTIRELLLSAALVVAMVTVTLTGDACFPRLLVISRTGGGAMG